MVNGYNSETAIASVMPRDPDQTQPATESVEPGPGDVSVERGPGDGDDSTEKRGENGAENGAVTADTEPTTTTTD